MRSIAILYDGPASSGRTTSLASAISRVTGQRRSLREVEGITFSIPDYPLEAKAFVSTVRGQYGRSFNDESFAFARDVRVHLERELEFLGRTEGIVFVVDSRVIRADASVDSFEMLRHELRERGRNPDDVPIIIQANQRDAEPIVSMDWIRTNFKTNHNSYVESVATNDIGTLEALKELFRCVA